MPRGALPILSTLLDTNCHVRRIGRHALTAFDRQSSAKPTAQRLGINDRTPADGIVCASADVASSGSSAARRTSIRSASPSSQGLQETTALPTFLAWPNA